MYSLKLLDIIASRFKICLSQNSQFRTIFKPHNNNNIRSQCPPFRSWCAISQIARVRSLKHCALTALSCLSCRCYLTVRKLSFMHIIITERERELRTSPPPPRRYAMCVCVCRTSRRLTSR